MKRCVCGCLKTNHVVRIGRKKCKICPCMEFVEEFVEDLNKNIGI